MKKSFVCFFTAVLFLLTVSCKKEPIQSDSKTVSETETTVVTKTTEVTEEILSLPEETSVFTETKISEETEHTEKSVSMAVSETCMLKPGVWYAYNDQNCSYYFISPDGKTARKVDVADALSTVFQYECTSAEKHEYKYFTSTGSSSFVLNITGEDTAELTEADKTVRRLRYCSDDTFERFQFFTDEELQSMALSYFETYSSRNTSNLMVYVSDNEDQTVDIYLYVVANGTQNILEIYSLDRFSAAGTCKNGEVIDLCAM